MKVLAGNKHWTTYCSDTPRRAFDHLDCLPRQIYGLPENWEQLLWHICEAPGEPVMLVAVCGDYGYCAVGRDCGRYERAGRSELGFVRAMIHEET